MGCPDQGNKAQTPVGYSHGTGVSIGGPVTAVTREIPRVTLGVEVLWWFSSPRAVGVSREVARQDERAWGCGSVRVEVDWVRNCQRTTTGAAKGVLGLPVSPGRRSVRVQRRPLAPGPVQGGIRAARGPPGR